MPQPCRILIPQACQTGLRTLDTLTEIASGSLRYGGERNRRFFHALIGSGRIPDVLRKLPFDTLPHLLPVAFGHASGIIRPPSAVYTDCGKLDVHFQIRVPCVPLSQSIGMYIQSLSLLLFILLVQLLFKSLYVELVLFYFYIVYCIVSLLFTFIL